MKKSVVARGTLAGLTLVGLLCFGRTPAIGAGEADILGKISLASLNKMKISEVDGKYVLETEITIQNSSENAVKLRKGSFESSIEIKEKVEGKTREITRVMPGKESSEEGKKVTEADRKTEDRVDIIDLGITSFEEVEIPGATKKDGPGTATTVSKVDLGPSKEVATMARLVRLSSLLGNPQTRLAMLLKGTAEIGVRLPNGWVFEHGKKYEVDLRFTPSVERKVLLN